MTDATLSFRNPSEQPIDLLDDELIKAIDWTNRASKQTRKAAVAGDVGRFTRALGRRRGLMRSGDTKKPATATWGVKPSLWLLPVFDESARTSALAELWRSFDDKMKRPKGKRAAESYRKAIENDAGRLNGDVTSMNWFEREAELAEWIEAVTPAAPLRPIELLVLAEILHVAGRELSPPLRWWLWRAVFTNSLPLAAQLEEPPGSSVSDEQRLVIAGLLPIVLGTLFEGINGASKLRKQGAASLAEAMLAQTDTDGTPSAESIDKLPTWLATFAVAKQWGGISKRRLWKQETEERYAAFVKSALSLFRGDGRLALSNGSNLEAAEALSAAAGSAGFRKKSLPMRLLSDVRAATRRSSKKRGPKVPKRSKKSQRKQATKQSAYGRPVAQSDWAKLACLRSNWNADADLLVVAHDGPLPHLDLSATGVPIIDGAWEIELTADNREVELLGEWESVCWFSDRDVDYLELQSKTDSGILVDRQIALSRKQNYACLIDCVHGAGDMPIEYTARLPLVTDVSTETNTETREITLRQFKSQARCYPLSLPCDRVDSANGEFTALPTHSLQLRQRSVGGLVAPIVIDWSKSRRKKPVDWRQLTVAESGSQVSADTAGGYSLRIGGLHLVVYRSLRPTVEGRSLLGLHTRHETVIGNFTRKGKVDPVMLVE